MIRQRRLAVLLTAWVALTLTWSATAIAAQTFYVSPSGNDAADGTSKKKAWRTLDRVALQTFVAGNQILLEGGGVHHGSIQLGPDRSAGKIAIGAYGEGRAVTNPAITSVTPVCT